MASGTIPSVPLPEQPKLPGYEIDYESLVTEDGKPVDSIYSERQHFLLTSTLIDSWKGPGAGAPFWITTDVGLFYGPGEPAFSPDVLLSVGVLPPRGDFKRKENHSYFVWKYLKPPDLIVEVVSNTEGGELTTKLKGYARIGVTYYIVWDPYLYIGDKALHCFALERGKYVPCEPRFPELELSVKTWEGTYGNMPATFLRWCDSTGALIPTGTERANEVQQRADEMKQRADVEKRRAEAEKRRAEAEKRRAEAEKCRADSLAEKLRALGVDPNQP